MSNSPAGRLRLRVQPWIACGAAALGTACATASPSTTGMSVRTQPAEVPVELTVSTGTVHGTLLLPRTADDARTAVVFISGSGPTDRDGNSPMLPGDNNSLRMLAEALAGAGVASIRYDKRGIAASVAAGAAEEDLRFQHLVDDAAAWVQRLRSAGDYDRVLLLGHSEGALVATLAAQQAQVDGLVLVAGTGTSLAATIRRQLAAQLPPPLMARVDSLFTAVREERDTGDVPPMFAALFRPSVQPYLRSVMDLDPAAELARVSAPVLIITGTTDVQVTVDDARLLAAARPDARLVIVEGMNHVLKAVEGTIQQQLPSYGDPTLPLVPELVAEIVRFVLRR